MIKKQAVHFFGRLSMSEAFPRHSADRAIKSTEEDTQGHTVYSLISLRCLTWKPPVVTVMTKWNGPLRIYVPTILCIFVYPALEITDAARESLC